MRFDNTISSISDRPTDWSDLFLKVLQRGSVTLLLLLSGTTGFNSAQAAQEQRLALGESVTAKPGSSASLVEDLQKGALVSEFRSQAEVNQEFDQRFDRLQLNQQIRQELDLQDSQRQFEPQEPSFSSPVSDRVQIQQQIQQQLNLDALRQDLRRWQRAGTVPSRALDQLQQQQVQQQLDLGR